MTLEQSAPRQASRVAGRSSTTALRAGLIVTAAFVVFKTIGGNFANEWEGWSTFVENGLFNLIALPIEAALTFGLLARIGLRTGRDGGNRPARAALLGGILGVASYVIFFAGLPFMVGAATTMLGLEGVRRARAGSGGKGLAVAGLVLAGANIAFSMGFYLTEITRGIFKWWI